MDGSLSEKQLSINHSHNGRTPLLKCLVAGTCVAFVGVVLHLVGIATTYWLIYTQADNVLRYGLFSRCLNDKCEDIPSKSIKNSQKILRAMVFLGLAAAVLALATSILLVVMTTLGKRLPRPGLFKKCSGACFFVAAVSVFIGLLILIVANSQHKLHEKGYFGVVLYPDFGYSFGLSAASVGLFLIAGILVLIGRVA